MTLPKGTDRIPIGLALRSQPSACPDLPSSLFAASADLVRRAIVVIAALVGCAYLSPSLASIDWTGQPIVERFEIPLPVLPQHYAVALGSDGTVYVGSFDGLLIGDGERWSHLELEGSMVRSLLIDGSRLYVGGYDTYGFVERDEFGRHIYTDLSTARPSNAASQGFADIWRIVKTRDGIHFGALRDTFVFNPDSADQRHFSHAGRFGAVQECAGETWLQFRGEGFRAWRAGKWQPLAHTASLTDLVSNLIPLGERCFGIGRSAGLFIVDGSELQAIPSPPGFEADAVHAAIALDETTIMMTTATGTILVFDVESRRLQRFAIHAGFLTDVVRSGDQILVSATTVLYRFSWPSPFASLGSMEAGRSSFTGARVLDDRVLLFADSDVYELVANADGDVLTQPLRWTTEATYDFLPGAAGRPPLLAGGHSLFERAPERLIDAATYPRLLLPDVYDASVVFVGSEQGLRQLRWADGTFALTPAIESEADRLVDSIVQVDPETAYVGISRSGVVRLRMDASRTIVARQPLNTTQDDVDAHVFSDNGLPMASLPSGVYRIEGDALVVDESFGALLELRKRDELLNFVSGSDRLWAFTSTQVFYRDHNGWREVPFSHPTIGLIVDVEPLQRGRVLIVGSDGVLQYDSTIGSNADTTSQLRITAALRIDASGNEHPLPISPADRIVLAPSDLGIRFQFALSGLRPMNRAMYRGRLVNYEPEFSAWERSGGYTYTRLRPGDYALQIEARDASGAIYSAPLYPIQFSAKWHEITWVRAALMALAILTTLMVGTLLYWRRTRLLRQLVAARTSELADANKRLDELAHHDALTQLPNRRRFDHYLQAIWTACTLQQRAVALLVIDVDHFKAYNDRHGHAAGDALLQAIAQVLRASVRRSEDLVARYGGEEFIVIMPGAHLAAAVSAGEQLRLAVLSAQLGVSVSIGAASAVPSAEHSSTQLFEIADRALYRAKQAGRNRVEGAPDQRA